MDLQQVNLAPFIDHTILKLDASNTDILNFCREAKTHHFAGVCVRGDRIPLVTRELYNTEIKPIAVVGFPTGLDSTDNKINQCEDALESGALEIDMVINIQWLKERKLRQISVEISKIKELCSSRILKVILETGQLSEEEKVIGSSLISGAGADFVKTSTGFGIGGATIKDIELIRRVVGQQFGVKASGGIRSKEFALALVAAGASRLGTSQSLSLIQTQNIPTTPDTSEGY